VGAQLGVAVDKGELKRAIELAERYQSESTSTTGLTGAAAGQWFNVGQAAAGMGDAVAARAAVGKALTLDRSAPTLLNAAFALAVIGDAAETEKLVAEAKRLPGARSDDAQTGFRAIDSLLKMRRHDRAALEILPQPKDDNDTGLQFVVGVVNMAFGNDEVAANQFKRIVDRPRPSLSPLTVEASLFYGRALVKMGKTDEARKAYERFLQQWKGADASLPVLAAARQEYAALGR
jgi:tetratricopeptide (TPR) repeat protein